MAITTPAKLRASERGSMEQTLPMVEIFDSVQGEGTRVGEPATFLRFAGCNLRCSWCDTPYSWSAEGLRDATPWTLRDLAARVRERSVILTGGEPLLHSARLAQLVPLLRQHGVRHVTVETNGMVDPGPLARLVDLWSVSPKLPGSGQPWDAAVVGRFAAATDAAVQLKFVIVDLAADWPAMWELLELAGVSDTVPLIVQPDGTREDYADALRELTELVIADDVSGSDGTPRRARVRVIPQTHRIAWGPAARGV